MYRRLSIENPFSFCGSACEPRSRPASHDGPGPAARMAVKDARSLRAAQRSSAARSLTATAAEGTSTWAGATRFILGSIKGGCQEKTLPLPQGEERFSDI